MAVTYEIQNNGDVKRTRDGTISFVTEFNQDGTVTPGWSRYQKWLTAGGTPTQEPSEAKPAIKARKVRRSHERAVALMGRLTRKYHPAEMTDWPALEVEAEAFIAAGPPKPVGPLMQAELDEIVARGATRTAANLANRIVARAANLRTLRNRIAAERYRISEELDDIQTNGTKQQLRDYVVDYYIADLEANGII